MPFAISRWLSDNRVRQGAARKDDAMTTHDRGGVRAALAFLQPVREHPMNMTGATRPDSVVVSEKR